LEAFGARNPEDDEQHAMQIAGAMMMAEGLLELIRLRVMITKALSK